MRAVKALPHIYSALERGMVLVDRTSQCKKFYVVLKDYHCPMLFHGSNYSLPLLVLKSIAMPHLLNTCNIVYYRLGEIGRDFDVVLMRSRELSCLKRMIMLMYDMFYGMTKIRLDAREWKYGTSLLKRAKGATNKYYNYAIDMEYGSIMIRDFRIDEEYITQFNTLHCPPSAMTAFLQRQQLIANNILAVQYTALSA